jgi:hypothetical protein
MGDLLFDFDMRILAYMSEKKASLATHLLLRAAWPRYQFFVSSGAYSQVAKMTESADTPEKRGQSFGRHI